MKKIEIEVYEFSELSDESKVIAMDVVEKMKQISYLPIFDYCRNIGLKIDSFNLKEETAKIVIKTAVFDVIDELEENKIDEGIHKVGKEFLDIFQTKWEAYDDPDEEFDNTPLYWALREAFEKCLGVAIFPIIKDQTIKAFDTIALGRGWLFLANGTHINP